MKTFILHWLMSDMAVLGLGMLLFLAAACSGSGSDDSPGGDGGEMDAESPHQPFVAPDVDPLPPPDPCTPNPCRRAYRKQCSADPAGDPVCSCDPGYKDYGDGDCRPGNPCAFSDGCALLFRSCVNSRGLAECGDCLPGYHEEGGLCIEDETCLESSCSGHGACDDAGGVVVCTCETGYAGRYCEACDEEAGYRRAGGGDVCTNDYDGDGVIDLEDNCPEAANPDQDNSDTDTLGDTCDPDDDNDGWADGEDCAPLDPDTHPMATEVCDGIDNDCDGETDERGASDCTLFYIDDDKDGWGALGNSRCLCAPEAPYTNERTGDCDDSDLHINPDQDEQCDGVDNDCDGETDEGC